MVEGYISPKGDKIIFSQDKNGNEMCQIFSLSVKKEETKQLTDNAYRTFGVSWHPNGKEVSRAIVTQKGFKIPI